MFHFLSSRHCAVFLLEFQMTEFNYQAIRATTGEILAEAISYSCLEEAYKDTPGVYIRNTKTGAEWDIAPEFTL